MRIALISTGGTIEKTYDALEGKLANRVSVLDVMLASLELRGATRASARRTLNVVWNLTAPIPQDTLDRLLPLCAATNVKLIVTQPQAGESQVGRFEEAYA